jgi:uncharacterized protein (DUF1499 family)
MSTWSIVIVAAVAIAVAAVGAFFIVGPERTWVLVGPADLGPVTFDTLRRRKSPNDSLACPPGVCVAKSDIVPPVFAVSADDLRVAFGKAVATEERIEQVASEDGGLTQRYIQRTKLMRFPDTIVVRFLDLGEGRSTLALYSRSQLGESDLGVNRARLTRWLDKLAKEAPAVQSA